MQGLDAWLEAPYVNRAREEADFERWLEANPQDDLDLDKDADNETAWERYESFLEDQEQDVEPQWDEDEPDHWEP